MRMRRAVRRLLLAVVALAAAAGLAQSQTPKGGGSAPLALVAAVDGPIGPGAVRHVEKAVEAARRNHAELLVLRLDTPGGLSTSMRKIISAILTSPVPVIGFVAPPGAHAASAGTYILYATDVAAMAPGTNLGAATPIEIGGGGIPGLPSPGNGKGSNGKTSGKENAKPAGRPANAELTKVTNDAVALIRSLAEMHGRNADWAEQAVRQAASLSAKQALAKGVIDLMANDTADLLKKLDGRAVTVRGRTVTLHTQGIRVEHFAPGFVTRALGILSNPNIALILMMVGVYGLFLEFLHPGAMAPGIIGAISLVLGLYALNQLPLDYAGLALVLIGIGCMVAEAITPTLGVLGIGGLIAFVIGAAMLVNTESPAYRISWWTIGGLAVLSGAVLILFAGYVWRTYRRPRRHQDAARVLGGEARVLDWSGDSGHVWAESERWAARGATDLAPGETVHVRDIDGLTLVVDRARGDEAASGADRAPARQQGG